MAVPLKAFGEVKGEGQLHRIIATRTVNECRNYKHIFFFQKRTIFHKNWRVRNNHCPTAATESQVLKINTSFYLLLFSFFLHIWVWYRHQNLSYSLFTRSQRDHQILTQIPSCSALQLREIRWEGARSHMPGTQQEPTTQKCLRTLFCLAHPNMEKRGVVSQTTSYAFSSKSSETPDSLQNKGSACFQFVCHRRASK